MRACAGAAAGSAERLAAEAVANARRKADCQVTGRRAPRQNYIHPAVLRPILENAVGFYQQASEMSRFGSHDRSTSSVRKPDDLRYTVNM